MFFFFNDTATTEIYTRSIVGSVRCVQETVSTQSTWVLPNFRPSQKTNSVLQFHDALFHAEESLSRHNIQIKSLLCEFKINTIFQLNFFFLELFLLRIIINKSFHTCLLYTSPSPRDLSTSRMPSSA
eukprot:TRINITY_DN68499_c0_g1_i1.p2 TRINITY_DN68499_c0_g1~~TRINITY_DN68499_c0_g1_i1.p2  ORF type:complete len:127 (+),score=30.20 TRINITY_DN68499_c0_g1_i1:98-478(+)